MDPERAVSVVIEGRVQGVSYCAWTRAEADALGLSGFVRNRGDGAVEAVFCGSDDAVARMALACWAGPPGARVTHIAVAESGDVPPGTGFAIPRA